MKHTIEYIKLIGCDLPGVRQSLIQIEYTCKITVEVEQGLTNGNKKLSVELGMECLPGREGGDALGMECLPGREGGDAFSVVYLSELHYQFKGTHAVLGNVQFKGTHV